MPVGAVPQLQQRQRQAAGVDGSHHHRQQLRIAAPGQLRQGGATAPGPGSLGGASGGPVCRRWQAKFAVLQPVALEETHARGVHLLAGGCCRLGAAAQLTLPGSDVAHRRSRLVVAPCRHCLWDCLVSPCFTRLLLLQLGNVQVPPVGLPGPSGQQARRRLADGEQLQPGGGRPRLPNTDGGRCCCGCIAADCGEELAVAAPGDGDVPRSKAHLGAVVAAAAAQATQLGSRRCTGRCVGRRVIAVGQQRHLAQQLPVGAH